LPLFRLNSSANGRTASWCLYWGMKSLLLLTLFISFATLQAKSQQVSVKELIGFISQDVQEVDIALTERGWVLAQKQRTANRMVSEWAYQKKQRNLAYHWIKMSRDLSTVNILYTTVLPSIFNSLRQQVLAMHLPKTDDFSEDNRVVYEYTGKQYVFKFITVIDDEKGSNTYGLLIVRR
jgi:hypothetical protein